MLPTEMYINYVQRRKTDYAELVKALEGSNYETFKKLGHQMKGNASSYGFDELATLAIQLEKVSAQDDKGSVKKLLDQMQEWIKKAEAQYPPG